MQALELFPNETIRGGLTHSGRGVARHRRDITRALAGKERVVRTRELEEPNQSRVANCHWPYHDGKPAPSRCAPQCSCSGPGQESRVRIDVETATPRDLSAANRERRRVFVLSDVRLYSDGLAALLAAEPSIDVAGSSALDDQGARRIIASRPDILIVDAIALRSSDFVARLVTELPAMLVVACGVREELEEVVACAQCGAAGYVARDASAEDLVRIVRSLERGELPCPPRIASMLFRQLAGRTSVPAEDPASALTTREREVIALVDRGLSNKEIAASLSIEVATVKNHVHRILEKLAVHRRSAATARLRACIGEVRTLQR